MTRRMGLLLGLIVEETITNPIGVRHLGSSLVFVNVRLHLYCVMITASERTASLSAFTSTFACEVARMAISKFKSVTFMTHRKNASRTTPASAIGASSNTCGNPRRGVERAKFKHACDGRRSDYWSRSTSRRELQEKMFAASDW